MAELLTFDETLKYLRAYRELQDQEALDILTIKNQGLVIYIAKRYMGKGLTFEELLSAGNEGLINGIKKFDYIENPINAFSTYISIAIERIIQRDLQKYNKHSKVISFEQPIGFNKDGDEMRVEDIIGTDSEDLIENVISEMKIDIVREALQCLTSREKQIILLRYGLDEVHKKTLEEVAEIFNCSRTTIMNQEQKALIKMRHPRNTIKLKDFLDE